MREEGCGQDDKSIGASGNTATRLRPLMISETTKVLVRQETRKTMGRVNQNTTLSSTPGIGGRNADGPKVTKFIVCQLRTKCAMVWEQSQTSPGRAL